MYLVLFLLGLPGQFFFGVTTMTMSAVVSTYLFGRLYFAATGIYFFYDSYIPISVFLGMHLLFNDPATSPRTELGRIIYGALYGLSAVGLYQLLGSAGMPTFYDKLLQVPLLNLSAKMDRSRDPVLRGSILHARSLADAAAAQPGVHVHLGGRVYGHERHARSGRQPSRPVAAVLAASLRGWPCVRLPVSRRFGDRASAIGDRAGRATKRVSCTSRSRDRARIFAGAIPREPREPLRRGCELGFAAACRNLTHADQRHRNVRAARRRRSRIS